MAKADEFRVSSYRQKLLPLPIGSWFKWYQVEFCVNPSISIALQKTAIKCYSQVANFLHNFFQLKLSDWRSKHSMRNARNFPDLMCALIQRQSATFVEPRFLFNFKDFVISTQKFSKAPTSHTQSILRVGFVLIELQKPLGFISAHESFPPPRFFPPEEREKIGNFNW